MSIVEGKVVKMNILPSYMEADSTNLPKVDTGMLFEFLKNGRKFSYTDFEKDKENLMINKYGDDAIGYVTLFRNSAYCVVKASIKVDDGNDESCFPIRVLIYETNNVIWKIECKRCIPVECIHSFALLMWLHRRTEETVDGIVNYYKKPGSIFNRVPKNNVAEDDLLTPKTSSPPSTTNYLNNSCSPDAKLFLHESGVLSQSSTYSGQLSQISYCASQQTSQETSQKSSSGSEFSQISNSGIATYENYQIRRSIPMKPSPPKLAMYSTHISQAVYGSTQYFSVDTSPKSSSNSRYSQYDNSQLVPTREYCESESSACTQPLPFKVVPLSQITNTVSPKQNKTMRKAPYTPKSAKISPPISEKKKSLLSKKVSQLVKQPKIDNFFMRPKLEVDGKSQIKNLFMGELVKNFLKLNKGTVEDFMTFAEKQMTDFLCQEAEKLTRVQRTDLWMDLRYGRITASIINEAACCHTKNGSLVNKILGKVGRYQSPAMKRGINLESKILQQVQIQENITINSSGLFLIPSCPIFGASPDAIGSDFVVEIKAPSSGNTFESFLPNGNINKKCKNQMYLQMYCTGMKRGIFCVADPNFERNKRVTTVWLDYDKEFDEVLEKAKLFWISAIFPRLVNS